MTELFGLQVETLEAIIVALGTSFVGTGTVAMIVRLALNRVTKKIQQKIEIAESENKISTENATKALASLEIFEKGVETQIVVMQQTIDKLIESNRVSQESLQSLLEEYKLRDERIKELLNEKLGDEGE